jgi:Protein of unknown function (DUF3102)
VLLLQAAVAVTVGYWEQAMPNSESERSSALSTIRSEFDYSEVPASVAGFLRGQAERIRRHVASSIIKIGKDLLAAKRYLSHGSFLKWLESEVGIPARSAQSYMQAAEWVGGKSATVAHLSPSLLYILSSPSTPKELTSRVLQRVEAGERIELSALRQELLAIRQANKQAEAADLPPTNEKRAEVVATLGIEAERVLLELFSLLAHRLSAPDFARLRSMLTTKCVVEEPDLGKRIVSALAKVSSPRTNAPASDRLRQLRPSENSEHSMGLPG